MNPHIGGRLGASLPNEESPGFADGENALRQVRGVPALRFCRVTGADETLDRVQGRLSAAHEYLGLFRQGEHSVNLC